MNIIIFGPQGSGKGTQADILAEKLKIPHISTGDIFRDNIKSQTKLGKLAQTFIDRGNLAPDEITIKIIKERLVKVDAQNGFILDGYPRNLAQVQALEQIIKTDLAMEVWISDSEALKRIGGRRSCLKCNAIYHLEFNPPKVQGKCDKCQSELIIRDDDKEEAIKKRLELYHQQTEPLIKYYQEQGIYLKIDGMPPIPEVTKEIFEKLKI